MCGWVNGWVGRWMDGWVGGWVDGCMSFICFFSLISVARAYYSVLNMR
jgi:hypothetical protein